MRTVYVRCSGNNIFILHFLERKCINYVYVHVAIKDPARHDNIWGISFRDHFH